MKGIGDTIWDELIRKSTTQRRGWGGDAGIVDGIDGEWISRSREKVEWLGERIREINPAKIIETGTNYGSFSWLLYNTLESFSLDTTDIVEESRECIERINEYYGGDKVRFHHSDALEFLKGWESEVDMAWLDSCHQTEYIKNELIRCSELRIPYLLVDDWNWVEIKAGVMEFLEADESYEIVEESPEDRGWSRVVVLKRKPNTL